jgi:uncharacterized protein
MMALDAATGATLPDDVRRDIVRRVLAATNAKRVVLFGSFAWGAPHADSDVDLLLVMSAESDAVLEQVRRAHASLRGLRRSFDILLTTEERLVAEGQVPGSLLYEISRHGEVLHA